MEFTRANNISEVYTRPHTHTRQATHAKMLEYNQTRINTQKYMLYKYTQVPLPSSPLSPHFGLGFLLITAG